MAMSSEDYSDDYDYYESDTEYDTSSGTFIDFNNYTMISDNEDNHSDLSVEIIDSDSDTEPNEGVVAPDADSNASNGGQEEDAGVEDRKKSEDMDDVKPDVNALNASVYSTQGFSDNSCIICTEMWTTGGDHQLVSLSCGHLFGRKCIEQWLDPKARQNQRCPHCNKAAKRKDIRVLYARNLRALDTSERDSALELLEKERRLRQKLEAEVIENSMKMKTILKENERLKKEYIDCQTKVQLLSSNSRVTENAIRSGGKALKTFRNRSVDCFQYIKDIEISSSGECRHLGYSQLFEIIAVSQPNPNPQLFPGYGVKKVFLNDFKTDNICIHSKAIRDLELNAYDGTILTASMDRTVKLTSLLSKASIISYDLEVDAWSVAFNPKNKHEFFVGLNNGQILLFDTRQMAGHVDRLQSSHCSPVVSLNHIELDSSVGAVTGLLSTQFQNFSLYERNPSSDSLNSSDFSMLKIPFEGRFGSAHWEPKSRLALLSCRPSSKHTNATHYVMQLKPSAGDQHSIEPEVVTCFEGGKQQIKLTRSRIFAHPFNANSALVCSGDESSNGALVWDLNSGECLQKLMSERPVLDMALLHNFNTNHYFMTSLTDTSVKFYKYIS